MRRGGSAAIAAVVVPAVLAGVFVLPGLGSTVLVGQVSIQGVGSCGLGSLITSGFSLPPAGEEQFSSANVNAPNCVIDSITSGTTGFEVVSANVPYVVGNQSGPLRWVVQGPILYNGDLTLTVHGTALNSSSNTAGNATCPNNPACVSSHIPRGLYLYSSGEVLSSLWIVAEAASLGALLGIVAWELQRKD